MNLFFTISLGMDLYLESQFLLAVQSAELFHRRKFPIESNDLTAHQARLREIISSVPVEEDRNWLRARLAFSHEPTLKMRLSELMDFAGPDLRNFLRPLFVKSVGDTRNFLTHYDDRLAAVAASGEDLWRLTQETIALIEYCFFRELGFASAEVFELCKRLQRYQSLLAIYSQSRVTDSPTLEEASFIE
jgi:hypothetical protein